MKSKAHIIRPRMGSRVKTRLMAADIRSLASALYIMTGCIQMVLWLTATAAAVAQILNGL